TAVQNCFAFIKAATLRDLELRTGVQRRNLDPQAVRRLAHESDEARAAMARTTHLVVNRAPPSDAKRVGALLHDLTGRFLGGRVRLVGSITDDPAVPASVRRMVPVTVGNPGCRAALEVTTLTKTLLGLGGAGPLDAPVAPPRRPAATARGLNEAIVHRGERLHIQTEALGPVPGGIRTQIFATNGGVVFSRKTAYDDPFFQRLRSEEHT